MLCYNQPQENTGRYHSLRSLFLAGLRGGVPVWRANRPCVFLLSTADPVHDVPGLLHKKAAPSGRNPAKMEVTLDRSAFAFPVKGYFMEFLVSNINGYLTFYYISPVLYDFRFCHVGLVPNLYQRKMFRSVATGGFTCALVSPLCRYIIASASGKIKMGYCIKQTSLFY